MPQSISDAVKGLLGANAYDQPPFRRITWPIAPPQSRGEELQRYFVNDPDSGITNMEHALRAVAGPMYDRDVMLPNENPQPGQQLDPRDTVGRLLQGLRNAGLKATVQK